MQSGSTVNLPLLAVLALTAMSALPSNLRFICSSVLKRVQIFRVRKLHFEKPAGSIRVGIDQAWVTFQSRIGFCNFAINWRINVAGRFDGLHNGDRLFWRHRSPYLR